MAWIRDRVDPDAPEATHIVLGIDCGEQAGIGERLVSRLLAYAMEGDEGVFYLLPQDLCYQAARSGELVTVELLSTHAALKGALEPADWEPAAALIPGLRQAADTDWITVLSATIPLPEKAALPGPPIAVIDHDGVTGLDELLAALPESGVHVVGPKPRG
jgi:hypothetical protein